MGKRLVVLPWSCQRTGDCCRDVLMTTEERFELEAATQRTLIGETRDKWFLLRGSCPLLAIENGKATCTVYEKRPYNCRRFACYRPDPKSEPLEGSHETGCLNLTDRLQQSREVRRDYALHQRRAQRWARQHGWSEKQ